MTDIALRRVIESGDGWLASGLLSDQIGSPISRLAELAEPVGKSKPIIIAIKTLPLDDVNAPVKMAQAYAEAGCDKLSHGYGYPNAAVYRRRVEILAERIIPSVGD